jgi:hypothetical protein
VNDRLAAGARNHACLLRWLLVLAALAVGRVPATAQTDNPLTPAPPHQVHVIPREGRVETAPVPPEKIIASFSARSDEYLRAHTMYGFKRSVRVQEFSPEGEKGREVNQESEVYLADNGRRYERSTEPGSQRFLDIKSASVDIQQSAQVPLFPLTSNQLQYYDLTYKGSQPLDELNTYIFEVKPKKLLPKYRLFAGIIYVDDQDLAIVKLYGSWKSLADDDSDGSSGRQVPFSLYEMYYENVGGKYWFPTFIRSDAYVHTKNGDEQLRLTVKMTDFKVTKPVPAPAGAPAGPGTASPATPPPAHPAKPDANGPAKPRA